MKKIETITKDHCRQFRDDLNPIIDKFLKETYGLSGRLGNASYTDKSVTFKLEIKAEGMSSLDKETADLYNWPEIGTTFNYAGKTFKVVEYAIKKRLKPIVVIDTAAPERGKYLFTADDVRKLAAATPK